MIGLAFAPPLPLDMKVSRHLLLLATASLLAVPPAQAVLGIFDDEELTEAPDPGVLAKQEEAARNLFQEARTLDEGGRASKARDLYESVVEDYPLTKAAADSQFALARSLDEEGESHKAFEAYQGFVDRFKQSDQFGEAIRRQFEIATKAMNGKTGHMLRVFPVKAQPSKIIELFRQVAKNAPYSTYAPQAIYNIGLVESEAGRAQEALAAFQEVVDGYPKDPKAKEASLRIIELRQSRRTRDDSQIARTQLEMEKFIFDYGDDPRSAELQKKVGSLEERDAEKKFEIGRFYEKKGNLRAAAIYYQEVVEGTSHYADAQTRLESIRKVDPNVVAPPSAPKQRVAAQTDVTSRPDYVGPPAPRLEEPPKPQMRASEEDVLPLPSP